MAKFIHYRCPDCAGVFRHLHHPSDAPPPERCPLCGAWVSSDAPPDPVFVPQAPRIRENAYAQSIDRVYRAEERASEQRAADAVATLEDVYRQQPKEGGPADEAVAHAQKLELAGLRAGIKITDMKDPTSMREGDVAAVTSTPKSLQEGGAVARFQNFAGAPPTAGSPGVGDGIRQLLTAGHGQRAASLGARDQLAPRFVDRR